MPFGALQFLVILVASWATQRFHTKSITLFSLTLPVIAGLVMLYTTSHTPAHQGTLMAGYYLLAFMFGGIPVIVAWIVGNTAGTTKKSAVMSVYNASASVGNIIGPLLCNSRDAPTYRPGLRAVLGMFVALAACVIIQVAILMVLNKLQERKRVRNGKLAKIKDLSMEDKYNYVDEHIDVSVGYAEGENGAAVTPRTRIGDQAFLDLTDGKNDEFVYIY